MTGNPRRDEKASELNAQNTHQRAFSPLLLPIIHPINKLLHKHYTGHQGCSSPCLHGADIPSGEYRHQTSIQTDK